MIEDILFKVNFWSTPVINFKNKKPKLQKLIKNFPEKKHGIQAFATNKQSNRNGFKEEFLNICNEELSMLSQILKKNIQLEDAWSVSYKSGEFHTPHNHGTTGLTGILYLEFDKTSPTTIFIQPWNNIENDTTFYYNMPANEGLIIIVPKFVCHFTKPNKSKKIKRIISFDMKIL
jgi:hypothetical protein